MQLDDDEHQRQLHPRQPIRLSPSRSSDDVPILNSVPEGAGTTTRLDDAVIDAPVAEAAASVAVSPIGSELERTLQVVREGIEKGQHSAVAISVRYQGGKRLDLTVGEVCRESYASRLTTLHVT